MTYLRGSIGLINVFNFVIEVTSQSHIIATLKNKILELM